MKIKVEKGSYEWDSIARCIILPDDKILVGIEIETEEIDWIGGYEEKKRKYEMNVNLLGKKIELLKQGFRIEEVDGKSLIELQKMGTKVSPKSKG